MSVLEELRSGHENIETLEKAVAQLLSEKQRKTRKTKKNYKTSEILKTEYAAKHLLDELQNTAARCREIYTDNDNLKKDEINFLGGSASLIPPRGGRNTDVWTNFYDYIKSIRDYYKKYPANNATSFLDAQKYVNDTLQVIDVEANFSAEEHSGKIVDLLQQHMIFNNMQKIKTHRTHELHLQETYKLQKKGLTPPDSTTMKHGDDFKDGVMIDYVTYLRTFDQFHDIPRHCKYNDALYWEYLNSLYSYLQKLFSRINPLADIHKIEKQFEDDFEQRWENTEIREWVAKTHQMPFFSLPTNKLFASAGTFESHIKGKKYKKSALVMMALSLDEHNARIKESEEMDKSISKLECMIQRYREALGDTIERTIAHHQKKQSQTAEEFKQGDGSDEETEEVVEEKLESDSDDDPDDNDKPIYNPLNLPLGFDGKPIPFWLYKLHGLGTEYQCEICGNYSYWGRRAFERHFQEWRHAFGMRCLKIPNTTHFKEITKIEDAIVLYEKLRKQQDGKSFRNENDIECEDSEGNVMSIRAYEDLRRQGLL